MNDKSKYYNKYYHKLIRYDIDDSYQYERLEYEHSIFVYCCYVRGSHTETINMAQFNRDRNKSNYKIIIDYE